MSQPPLTPLTYDAIVIGAGLNGLSAAAYLARAGRRVLVLDRRDRIGGSAATEEFAPGYRASATAGLPWVSPAFGRELELDRHGLEWLPPEPALVHCGSGADPFVLSREPARAVEAIAARSAKDASRWPAFAARLSAFAAFLGWLYHQPPPRPVGGRFGDVVGLLSIGRRLRALGKADLVELARVLPLPIADLVNDTFERDELKGAIGAGGVSGLGFGPRAAGTAFLLLHHHAGAEAGAIRMRQRVRGGSGALAGALARVAEARGATIRTGAGVSAIRVTGDRTTGVVLDSGEEIAAPRVLSSANARQTLIDLVGPAVLDPELVRALQHIRFRGVVARVHLSLDALPDFAGVPREALGGVISIADGLDGIERAADDAKYGAASARPILEARIPSIADPSLAPSGRHVMSIAMQYAPYRLREGVWDAAAREALGDAVVRRLAELAPNLAGLVTHRRVLTPLDLEREYGLPEGSADHGELALDQVLFMRPVPACARYRTPIRGLYLCGAGSHPANGVAGGAGRLAAQAALSP